MKKGGTVGHYWHERWAANICHLMWKPSATSKRHYVPRLTPNLTSNQRVRVRVFEAGSMGRGWGGGGTQRGKRGKLPKKGGERGMRVKGGRKGKGGEERKAMGCCAGTWGGVTGGRTSSGTGLYPPTGKLYILYYPRILYVSAYLYIFENSWPNRIQYVCASMRISICTGSSFW